jgi:exoribonuclease II
MKKHQFLVTVQPSEGMSAQDAQRAVRAAVRSCGDWEGAQVSVKRVPEQRSFRAEVRIIEHLNGYVRVRMLNDEEVPQWLDSGDIVRVSVVGKGGA